MIQSRATLHNPVLTAENTLVYCHRQYRPFGGLVSQTKEAAFFRDTNNNIVLMDTATGDLLDNSEARWVTHWYLRLKSKKMQLAALKNR